MYAYTVLVSVTLLYENGKRLSSYAIRTAAPAVGWLILEPVDFGEWRNRFDRARLVDRAGSDLLGWLDHARLVACKGHAGALIEGIEYRKKGVKHSTAARQAWWCEAPPRTFPLLDQDAHIRAGEAIYLRQKIAGWGED